MINLGSICHTNPPCKNNGTCVPNKRYVESYTCKCQDGYVGHTCDIGENCTI